MRAYTSCVILSPVRSLGCAFAQRSAQRQWLSTTRVNKSYEPNTINQAKRGSAYGWQYHLDNTVQFILWASFGSAAIHLLNIKQKYSEKERKMSTKIAILKDVIRRIGNGEEVDVAKELRVGKTEEEREWEEVMNSFREDAGVGPKEVKEADSNGETLSPITTMSRNADGSNTSLHDKSIHKTESSDMTIKRNSGWFWRA